MLFLMRPSIAFQWEPAKINLWKPTDRAELAGVKKAPELKTGGRMTTTARESQSELDWYGGELSAAFFPLLRNHICPSFFSVRS